MLNAFLLFGRSPHKPPPSSRQYSYNLEGKFPNPKHQVKSFVPNIPCTCSPYPAFFQRKVQWQAMHFGTAHSSIPVRKKIAFALPIARFQHLKAFFSFPPYRCLSLRFSSVFNRESLRFPMFLQHIAVIPFSDALHRFIPAVYALPSPRTAVCRHTRFCLLILALACRHTDVFPIPFPPYQQNIVGHFFLSTFIGPNSVHLVLI